MIEAIREVVDFVETGAMPSFAAAAPALDAQAMRIASIKLLSWLKSEARRSTERRLELNPEFGWTANLLALVSASSELAVTFGVSNGRLGFATNVPIQDRREIANFVEEHFHPRLMT